MAIVITLNPELENLLRAKYHIEISSVAEAEADTAFLQLSQVTSPIKASQWYSGLLQAIGSLDQMSRRCSL